jgi:signal transduction histidine kinase
MSSTLPSEIPQQWTPRLRWSFILIIAGFGITALVSIYEMRVTQTKVQLIMEHAVDSIQLVSELTRNISYERRLLVTRIADPREARLPQLRTEFADADARIDAAATAYEPTIATNAEYDVWRHLEEELQDVRPKAETLLNTSFTDGAALVALRTIEPEFDSLNQTMDTLVRLNRSQADEELAHIRTLQRVAIVVLAGLTGTWIVFALLIASWVTRLIWRRETQMRNVTNQLEERNRELDAFAGRVAHDLRGPLTAINLATFLKQEGGDDTANAAFRRGVKQMETIIKDLLLLSRVSAQPNIETCETTSAAAAAEQDIRPAVEATGGVLHLEVAPAVVRCSHGLLRQLLWNLGENAVKYRRSGIPLYVELRGCVMQQAYEFTVSDNGTGMSHSDVQHAFEAFYRGEQTSSRPGTGLGLSIVKRVVEVNGGSVAVESTPGRGATFKISLPLAEAKAA